ncbi:MAG: hypothetical protein V3V00_15860 [Saprospiraceae bacterium]
MNKQWSEQYKDPKWQKKRLEILERDGWKCKNCLSKEKTLHVHHISYDYNKKVWDYHNCRLVSLCDDCHKREHLFMKDAYKNLEIALELKNYIALDIVKLVCATLRHKDELIEFISDLEKRRNDE